MHLVCTHDHEAFETWNCLSSEWNGRRLEQIEADIRGMMHCLANPKIKSFRQVQAIIAADNPDVWEALSFQDEYRRGWNRASKTDVLEAWLEPRNQVSSAASSQHAVLNSNTTMQHLAASPNLYSPLETLPDSQSTNDEWDIEDAEDVSDNKEEAGQGKAFTFQMPETLASLQVLMQSLMKAALHLF